MKTTSLTRLFRAATCLAFIAVAIPDASLRAQDKPHPLPRIVEKDVPETGNRPAYARHFFATLGHQAIGFSPFRMDYTRIVDSSPGPAKVSEESLAPFAHMYGMISAIDRVSARLNLDGKLQADSEEKETHTQSMEFGAWKANISCGVSQFGPGDHPAGNPEPIGGAMAAQLGENEFLVTGFFVAFTLARLAPHPASSGNSCASKKALSKAQNSTLSASGMATKLTGASTFRPRPRCFA